MNLPLLILSVFLLTWPFRQVKPVLRYNLFSARLQGVAASLSPYYA
jgi:hypothetical protein